MPTICLDLEDFKAFVIQSLNYAIESRAALSIRTTQLALGRREQIERYLAAMDEAKPASRDHWKLAYRELLESLETGNGVAEALSEFICYERDQQDRKNFAKKPLY
jgi:hypothetical protein